MKKVMTLRIPEEELNDVEKVSKSMKQDRSKTVRELIDMGKIYFALKQYRSGKISIGKASETARLSISEFMDLLTELGMESKLEEADLLEGKKIAQELF